MIHSKGRILQLQNYSVNDGEGIRTIVFFAGCPLRCLWCANPEGYTGQNQIMYLQSRASIAADAPVSVLYVLA